MVFIATRQKCWNNTGRCFRAAVSRRIPLSARRLWIIAARFEVGPVARQPGDLVFGDLDGVVLVPKRVEAEVVERALAKARREKLVRKEIEAGMSSTAAFKKYGIL